MSRTPSGGAQLFFRVPSRLSHKASIGALAPGIDTKCNASYIVMPPSYGCYTKDLGSGPVEIRGHWEWWTTDDFAELPRAWQDAILALDKPPTRGAAGKARSHDIDELVAGARTNNGSWHNNVVRLVGNLVSRGRDDSEILAWAHDITCPGFSIDQTRADLAKMIAGARAKGWSPPPLDDGWTCASDIAPKDVEFLWEPRLIASKMNLLAGLGGKDILCSDIIARVTTGG